MRSIVSTTTDDDSAVLLLGADGRLGRMMRAHWPRGGQLRGQSRRAVQGLLRLDPLADAAGLKDAARGMESVICLSGVTPAHAAQTGDAMDLNTDLALAAIAAAPEGARVFVASSAAVYGAAEGPHLEGAIPTPASAYGHAKLAMEQAALAAGGGRVCVLRIGNVAGADAILGGWRAGMELDVFADGRTPQRSYIGPQSLARVVHALSSARDLPPVLNIAAPAVVEMGDLLDAAGLVWRSRAAQKGAIAQVALGTAALEQFYTFRPEECTAQGMVIQWREGRAAG